jgi:hypothetical protein
LTNGKISFTEWTLETLEKTKVRTKLLCVLLSATMGRRKQRGGRKPLLKTRTPQTTNLERIKKRHAPSSLLDTLQQTENFLFLGSFLLVVLPLVTDFNALHTWSTLTLQSWIQKWFPRRQVKFSTILIRYQMDSTCIAFEITSPLCDDVSEIVDRMIEELKLSYRNELPLSSCQLNSTETQKSFVILTLSIGCLPDDHVPKFQLKWDTLRQTPKLQTMCYVVEHFFGAWKQYSLWINPTKGIITFTLEEEETDLKLTYCLFNHWLRFLPGLWQKPSIADLSSL